MSERARLVLWPAIIAHFVAYGGFTLIAPLYALRLGASTATIGIIVALGFVLPLALALPAGAVLPRIGLRAPLLVGPVLVALGAIGPLLVPGLVPLAIAEILVGLGHLAVVLAGQTAVGSLGAATEGEANFGAYGASVAAGQMIGPLVAGALADAAGLRTAFAVAVAAALVAGTILTLGRRHLSVSLPSPARLHRPGWLATARSPALRYAMTVSGMMVLARTAHSTFLPVYLAQHGFGSGSIGLLVGLLALVTVVVRPLLPVISRLLGGQARSLLLALAATFLGAAAMAIPPSWTTLLGMTLLLGTGVGLGQPLSMALASASTGAARRGLALGYRITVNRLTQVLTPAVLGIIANDMGVASAFVITGVTIGALLPVMCRLRGAVPVAAAERGAEAGPHQ